PGAAAFRSTATTRAPSSRTRSIAYRWWRPAPTKRIVPGTGAMLLSCRSDPDREEEGDPIPAPGRARAQPVEVRPHRLAAIDPVHARRGVVDVQEGARCRGRRRGERVLDADEPRAGRPRVREGAPGRAAAKGVLPPLALRAEVPLRKDPDKEADAPVHRRRRPGPEPTRRSFPGPPTSVSPRKWPATAVSVSFPASPSGTSARCVPVRTSSPAVPRILQSFVSRTGCPDAASTR